MWFKNRRVKSKKQLPPAIKFRPLISANQSTILQPSYYSLSEVQRENWPCSSADGFVSETLRCSGTTLPFSDGSWSHGQSSSMYTYHDSSPGSFETTALSYGSSDRQLSNYSNVPWIDAASYLKASVPLDRQGDQRAPEGNRDPGPQQWAQRNSPHPTLPWIESQITVTTYSTVPWMDTSQGPRDRLPFDNQSERTAPNDPGANQWDQRNGHRAITSWNQITETSHSIMRPQQASMHELEYTSLLDDILAVVKLNLATENNKADPSFLGNIPNMQ